MDSSSSSTLPSVSSPSLVFGDGFKSLVGAVEFVEGESVGDARMTTFNGTVVRVARVSTIDVYGVRRGRCVGCDHCSEFLGDAAVSPLCLYCGCVPAKHDRLEEEDSEASVSLSVSPPKRFKADDGRC